MPGLLSKLDEMGGAVRRIIGDLADDRSVYYPFTTIASGDDMYLGEPTLRSMGRYQPPSAGSESGMLSPFELISRAAYPSKELADLAAQRTARGPMQSPWEPNHIPLLVRPEARLPGGAAGRFARVEYADQYQPSSRVIEIAGGADDALRSLIHEARHATETGANYGRRALSSISSHDAPGIDGRVLSQDYRRYLASPSEMLAYLGEAGDDFVRAEGRLVNNARDANAVMEMLESGEAASRLHPLSRQLYVDSYKKSPRARANINEILTRYFAVPAMVLSAGAAAGKQGAVNR